MSRFIETKVDGLSPHAYAGTNIDPYNTFNGGMMVSRESGFSVEDFINDLGDDQDPYDPNIETYDPNYCDDPDGLFGIGNQKKKAERKIRKAEKKLERGKTKAAARKLKKGTAILDKIQKGQTAQATAIQQLADIKTSQGNIAQMSADYQQQAVAEPIISDMQTLSTQPMSSVGSNMGGGGAAGGAMSATDLGTGVESTSDSGEPTGWLANPKTLGGVTVTSPKKNKMQLVLIVLLAVVVIGAIIYFAKKGKK